MAQTKLIAIRALRMSTELTSPEAVRDRVERATNRINQTLENQCLNPETVVEEYGATCARAVDDPEGRAARWLDAVE